MASPRTLAGIAALSLLGGCAMENPAFNASDSVFADSENPGDGDGDGASESASGSGGGGGESDSASASGDGDGDNPNTDTDTGPDTGPDTDSDSTPGTAPDPSGGDEAPECGELTECLGECVDLDFSDSHCGMCEHKCTEGSYCEEGECIVPGAIVFVTSEWFSGQFGGLAGADDACQLAAEDAGLPGVYRAWLATEQDYPAGPDFNKEGPFVLTDGISVVADSWATLITGQLLHPIDLNEFGEPADGPPSCEAGIDAVWSGVTAKGEINGENCNGWTSTQFAGRIGLLGSSDFTWTQTGCTQPCYTNAPIYCFEQ